MCCYAKMMSVFASYVLQCDFKTIGFPKKMVSEPRQGFLATSAYNSYV